VKPTLIRRARFGVPGRAASVSDRIVSSNAVRVRAVLAGLVLCAPVASPALSSPALPSPTLADCDVTSHAVVLQAAPTAQALEARAIWLTASLLRWPGAAADGRFRLYHSASGSATAVVGAPVAGADGALTCRHPMTRSRTQLWNGIGTSQPDLRCRLLPLPPRSANSIASRCCSCRRT